ncbi:MAG: 3D domain-containing protein [Deltaproteobacteria bacterium]|nr:3D domain-containing protein [Deltaproteobacteria bacterium]
MMPLKSHIPFVPILFVLIMLFIFGCSTLPRDKEPQKVVRRMLVTAYDAGQKSTGWKRKYGCCLMPPVYAYGPNEGKRKIVGMTSSGAKAKKGTIAADIRRYPYGTKMHIPGYGWGTVEDTGSAITGDHIDVFFPDLDDAMTWGKKHLDVTIIKP